jgi:type IV pilus assembly protein PilM
MREAHVTTTQAAFAIPFSSSLVTPIEMRVLDPKELATAVPIEARKYVPVPISEVNLDWWIIPEEPAPADRANEIAPAATEPAPSGGGGPQTLHILIAAIHHEATNRFQSLVSASGLESSFFEIEIFSTVRALFPQDLEPHAVLDLGAGETKLYIIDRGLPRFSHIISHGAQDMTLALSRGLGVTVEEAEQLKREQGLGIGGPEDSASLHALLNVVFSETNRALGSFERRFGKRVGSLALSGGGANLAGIERLAEQSSAVAVERANPFAQVEAPAFLDEVLTAAGPEFTVALGVAFRKLQEAA